MAPRDVPDCKAMVSTVRPNASETPGRPMPTSGNAAARTAAPHPPKVSQKVPISSAAYFLMLSSPFHAGQTAARSRLGSSLHGSNGRQRYFSPAREWPPKRVASPLQHSVGKTFD